MASSHSLTLSALSGSSGSRNPPGASAVSNWRRRVGPSDHRARIWLRADCSLRASSPSRAGRIRSIACRTILARPAEAPPVPTAISKGSRSTIAGVVKSHSSGWSTTLTSSPRFFRRAATIAASSVSSIATNAKRASGLPSSTQTPPARSIRRLLASAASPSPSRMTGLPRIVTKSGSWFIVAQANQSGTCSASRIVAGTILSATTA